jgi:chromosome segregation ATPase
MDGGKAVSGSPYLEHIAQLEQEIEEHRDAMDDMAAKMAGMTSQRDEMKRQLTIALTEMVELRKECQRLKDGWDDAKQNEGEA